MIQLSLEADELRISVADDGAGFHPEKMQPGLGLNSITGRFDELGGSLRIHSTPGRGTTVLARVPLESLQPAQA